MIKTLIKVILIFLGILLIIVSLRILTNLSFSDTKEDIKVDSTIKIPQPDKLYEFTCNVSRLCKKEALTYVVNVDGLDFIPDENFIQSCHENKQNNKYCVYLIEVGTIETLQMPSEHIKNFYIERAKNPALNNNYNKKMRLKNAKQSLMNGYL